MMDLDDNQIVELFWNRDQEALSQCSQQYGQRLRNLSYRITSNWHDAEECENDTYWEAWCSIPPQDPRTYLFAYLARITRHRSLDICRRRLRRENIVKLTELTDEAERCIPVPMQTADQVDSVLLGQSISRFLKAQPEEKRNIFIRRYWYLDSVSQIAQRFSCSEGKVKMVLSRMRKGLRIYLEKEGYFP